MNRRGFTLVEMLVATIVFLIGFVAVFGLFLGGMRFRKLSEDTTRASLAASCLVDEIRISAGGSGQASPSTSAPLAPSVYIGTGFSSSGSCFRNIAFRSSAALAANSWSLNGVGTTAQPETNAIAETEIKIRAMCPTC